MPAGERNDFGYTSQIHRAQSLDGQTAHPRGVCKHRLGILPPLLLTSKVLQNQKTFDKLLQAALPPGALPLRFRDARCALGAVQGRACKARTSFSSAAYFWASTSRSIFVLTRSTVSILK